MTLLTCGTRAFCPHSVYAPFSAETFRAKFLDNPISTKTVLLVAVKEGKIIGFGNAVYNNQGKDPRETPGYVTCVAVDKKLLAARNWHENPACLGRLLKARQTYVRCHSSTRLKLEWRVPGYDRHEHPNAPAIPFNSPFYFLLLANGYNVNGQEDAYHVNLSEYKLRTRW